MYLSPACFFVQYVDFLKVCYLITVLNIINDMRIPFLLLTILYNNSLRAYYQISFSNPIIFISSYLINIYIQI